MDTEMAALRGWPSFPEELPAFDPLEAPRTPQQLFLAWLDEAGEHVLAPHAATLSTVDSDGVPDARVVILKDLDHAGWYVASSAHSPKGVQLAKNPRAALTFFWPGRGRQVRLRGPMTPTSPEISADDFHNRSPASRAEALIGHQSEILEHPRDLLRAAEDAARRVEENPDVVAEGWTRYLITPESVEFWQASHDRRHVRLRYRRDGENWLREPLWP
jgi:pyridoxamine 5'-phosphate oxidase